MTAEEAKKVLEGYVYLECSIFQCDHMIELFYPFRDLKPEICEKYQRDKEAYIREQERILKAIDRIPDEQHRKLLRLRFIERKGWLEVAMALWLSDANGAIRKAKKSYQLFAEQYDAL